MTDQVQETRAATLLECVNGARAALDRYSGVDSGQVQRELALARTALEEVEMRGARAVAMAHGLFAPVDVELAVAAQQAETLAPPTETPPANRAARRAKKPAAKKPAARKRPAK